ncbi:MAG: hypothetical protein BWK73_23465 [Thiothrix lacustris]|uniref:Uncharacterized protein n=1 Tax=Thiothrix lacustris TaxID=525917 RepID=A0A1Y1QMD2_9GAMM|nr:MAG: hypothetical protein BWK73_23465 [Thiothrix lacustris]
MPKLVIKQDLPEPSLIEKLEGLLRVILPVLLFSIVLAAALLFYLSRESNEPVTLENGMPAMPAAILPLAYTQEAQHLTALAREFETQENVGVEEYAKHARLVSQAEALLDQLRVMDKRVDALAVDAATKQALLTRHQYQKDYWEAKRVFHDLRLSRFNESPTAQESPPPAIKSAEKSSPDAPAPAPNVDLPKDFCPLFGPGAAACRPGAGDKP